MLWQMISLALPRSWQTWKGPFMNVVITTQSECGQLCFFHWDLWIMWSKLKEESRPGTEFLSRSTWVNTKALQGWEEQKKSNFHQQFSLLTLRLKKGLPKSQSFIHHVFIKHLLCNRHSLRSWLYIKHTKSLVSDCMELSF